MSLEEELMQFTGTTSYHRLTLMPLLATDGVAYFVKKASANWLFDDMAIKHFNLRFEEPFICVTAKGDGETAEVKYTDGNRKVLALDKYHTSDLNGEFQFFITDNVCMIPSEY